MLKKIEKLSSLVLIVCILSLLAYNLSLDVKDSQAVAKAGENDVIYTQSHYYKQPFEIKLSVNALGEYVILVNGQTADSRVSSEGYDTLTVYHGDVVSIDLRNCDGEVSVFVAQVSDGITEPKVGTKMFMKDGIKSLFVIDAVEEK